MRDDDTEPRNGRDIGEEIAATYRSQYRVLEYLVTRKFKIPDDDARGVIHDVFVAFIRNRHRIRDERSWLIGATCIQSRLYWRNLGDERFLCDDDAGNEEWPAALADDVAARVDLSNVLQELPARCRELLHMRFYEQRSSEEIAGRYATTIDYARKLLHRCILRAREVFARRRGAQP